MLKWAEAGRDVKVLLWKIQMGKKDIGEIGQGRKKTGWDFRFRVGLQVILTEADGGQKGNGEVLNRSRWKVGVNGKDLEAVRKQGWL